MGRALTPSLTVLADTTIRRTRELPIEGELLVGVGDQVTAEQVVARAELPGELHILRLAEKMGIEGFEVVEGLKIKASEEVATGDVLCEHMGFFGLFRSKYTSPESGVIEFITERTGHLGLRLPSTVLELNGYLSGKVVEIAAGKSLVIEANGALVQGIFGVGGERHGTLVPLDIGPGEPLTEAALPHECSGGVLVGGTAPSIGFLNAAAEAGAVGLVTGAIDDRTLAVYLGFDIGVAITGDEDVPLTVIVTEGFGSLPISDRVLDIVSPRSGKQAALNGATQVRAGAVRPELILCEERSPDGPKAETMTLGLDVGSRVRLIRYPYFGQLAEVVELPPEAETIPTGARTRVLRAKLSDGETVTVPRANVELVG